MVAAPVRLLLRKGIILDPPNIISTTLLEMDLPNTKVR